MKSWRFSHQIMGYWTWWNRSSSSRATAPGSSTWTSLGSVGWSREPIITPLPQRSGRPVMAWRSIRCPSRSWCFESRRYSAAAQLASRGPLLPVRWRGHFGALAQRSSLRRPRLNRPPGCTTPPAECPPVVPGSRGATCLRRLSTREFLPTPCRRLALAGNLAHTRGPCWAVPADHYGLRPHHEPHGPRCFRWRSARRVDGRRTTATATAQSDRRLRRQRGDGQGHPGIGS